MFSYAAFLVGFLGSFHCAGMCGPIALALPVNNGSKASAALGRLIYNGGRIFTYVVLGLAAGLIGHRIAMTGFQRSLSVVSGILILLVAAIALLYPRIHFLNSFMARYTNKIKSVFRNLFGKKSRTTLFFIGVVNGLLPCGFVYLALAAAVAAGDVLGGAGYMLWFGLGTLPMMFGLSYAGNIFGVKFNRFFRQLNPYVAFVVAALLIYRGFTMVPGHCH